jgi:hypothetical protein
MKPLLTGLIGLVLVTGMLCAPGAQGQAAERTSGRFHYDAGKEVTIKGTVSEVVKSPTAEMMSGSHLLVSTDSGKVDVSLGRFALRGRGALAANVGEYLEITGVTMMLKGAEVFVARTVKVGEQVYVIRNEHGIAVSPQSRERASRQSSEKGEAL